MSYPASMKEEARRRYKRGVVREQDVADALGVSKATVHRWLYPKFEASERVKARKRKWESGGKCIVCGKPTSRRRIGEPNKRCRKCQRRQMRKSRYWTDDRIIDAIQHWVDEHGEVPLAKDWDRSGPDHPCLWTVCRSETAPFTNWADAVRSAGFRPRRGAGVGERASTKRLREKQKKALAKALANEENQ